MSSLLLPSLLEVVAVAARSVKGAVVAAVNLTTGDAVVAVADHRGVPSEARPQGGAKKAGSVFM